MDFVSFYKREGISVITRIKKGDKEAFLNLIEENTLHIYRVARGILHSEADIEDAIQNTIIKAYENIAKLKKEEYFRTWLVRILINECNMILRANKKTIPIDSSIKSESYEDSHKDTTLIGAVNSLEEDLRGVTILYYFEDMAQRDIAKLLNIPEGTVRSRLTRARKKLFEIMKEDEK